MLRVSKLMRRLLWLGALGLSVMPATATETPVKLMETTTGVQFGLWGRETVAPAPTLFILANSIDGTLGDPYFRQSGNQLAEQGYLCVTIDIPGHGEQHRADEPEGLAGWRYRLDHDENLVAETNRRLSEVLDFLIATGRTDPSKVAACGTSRGGFLAMQFTAAEPRVKCVAAFAPVTDLLALREFDGAGNNALVTSLSVINQAEKLADRPVWIIMGDRDERVGTDQAVALARAITASALTQGLNPAVELHVLPEPKGHTTPHGAPAQAATWIAAQLAATQSE
jgi:dienelactone hydrolase